MTINAFKTACLMSGTLLLFAFVGHLLGGQEGMLLALLIGGCMNVLAWWNSDKMVLGFYRAKPAVEKKNPLLWDSVKKLSQKAKIPMPQLYIIEEAQPNAFATGRSPHHASVAITAGLLETLNKEELQGVIAHELAHIIHRDTLIATICATVAGAISMLANFALFFGHSRNNEERSHHPAIGLIIALLAPIAAALIQMAIARSREFEADRKSALMTRNPMALADALIKIENHIKRVAMPSAITHPETAQMMIINPIAGVSGIVNLFCTHPPTKNRVEQLKKMASSLES